METAGSVETQAVHRATSRWLSALGAALAFGLLPTFVVAQWLALKWGLPTRFWFNAIAGLVSAAVVIIGWRRIPTWLRWLGLATAGVLVASWLLNDVPVATVLRGALPYAVPVVASAAGFAALVDDRTLKRALLTHVVTAGVLVVAAAAQLVVGEPAYRWFGQDLAYPRWWERGRATGLVVNPGRLAQIGLTVAALGPMGARPWSAIAAGAFLAAASGGRVAVAAAVVFLGVGLLFWRLPHRRWYVGAAGLLVLGLAVVLTVSPNAREDLFSRTEASLDDLSQADDIIEDTRVASLEAGLAAWRQAPILGWGPGRFGSTTAWATQSDLHEQFGLPDLRSPEIARQLREAGDTREIDVGTAQLDLGLLQVSAETGGLGLVANLALLAGILWEGWRRRRPASVALVGLTLLFSLIGPGIVDSSLVLLLLWWAGAATST